MSALFIGAAIVVWIMIGVCLYQLSRYEKIRLETEWLIICTVAGLLGLALAVLASGIAAAVKC